MVKYCEVFNTAVEAFESAALHEVITELGRCKLGKINGFWYVVWG
ncbi:hypothetical protein QGX13_gp064 [Pseudomonas phage M5.1]|uniref:Uncharacterized protein n=1 Tax=Pseudomonas phage M5.1 TaxID=2873460 RepID=A0AAE8XIB8_9CAUD|nr:hypothetical protein QGX13_gp064 [Pseudomonas phage M5.1]UAV89759.1 hypothetical protein M51_178 [Pseudomonas phage M5.1]